MQETKALISAMTGESRGGSRAAAPGCGFSRGTTARSVSLSWGPRQVGSPCEWRGPQGIIGEFLSFFIRSFLLFILSLSSFSFPLPSFLPVIHSFYSCILSSHSFSFHQALGHGEGRTESEVKECINLCERRKVNKKDRLHNGQVPVQNKHVRPFVKKIIQNFKVVTAEH